MIFNMNFELRNELANFGTKFEIFWQKLCEIDCKIIHTIQQYKITYFVNQPVTQVDTAPTMPD